MIRRPPRSTLFPTRRSSDLATELAGLIRAKTVSPVELTRAVLARSERLTPTLNAVCTLTAEQALEAAREAEDAVMRGRALGPLHGIPFTIKDLAFTKGVRTMSGSCIFAERVPEVDAPFVRRLREAGGVMLGKTTTPEFGWKAIGDSPLTGISRNPWNPGMTTGGSSAGAGAAAAAGLGPLHQGSDGAGSIRIPSGFCGIYGLKPSYGRVPMWPISNNDYTSHVGPMTRTVADAALMLAVMAGPGAGGRPAPPAPPPRPVGPPPAGGKGRPGAGGPGPRRAGRGAPGRAARGGGRRFPRRAADPRALAPARRGLARLGVVQLSVQLPRPAGRDRARRHDTGRPARRTAARGPPLRRPHRAPGLGRVRGRAAVGTAPPAARVARTAPAGPVR